MSMNAEYFLKRLQEGEDADAIAREIADALNQAEKDYEAIQKQKVADSITLAAKREAMRDVLVAMGNYAAVAGNEDFAQRLREMTEIEEIDKYIKQIDNLLKFAETLESLPMILDLKDFEF